MSESESEYNFPNDFKDKLSNLLDIAELNITKSNAASILAEATSIITTVLERFAVITGSTGNHAHVVAKVTSKEFTKNFNEASDPPILTTSIEELTKLVEAAITKAEPEIIILRTIEADISEIEENIRVALKLLTEAFITFRTHTTNKKVDDRVKAAKAAKKAAVNADKIMRKIEEKRLKKRTLVEEYLDIAERKMRIELEDIRSRLTHPGDKGSGFEEILRDFLRRNLPQRLGVGQGEVIDSHGAHSKQSDIVIFTQDHPLVSDTIGFFFVEGVCGIGEVKANLDSKELRDCLNKARVAKTLKIDPGRGTSARFTSETKRFYTSPPWFVFAFKSSLDVVSIKETLEKDIEKNGASDVGLIDGIFALDKGCVIDFSKERGIQIIPTKNVLLYFLYWIGIVLPTMNRVESILTSYIERTGMV